MTAPMEDGEAEPVVSAEAAGRTRLSQIRQAAGIYGLIVTAAVLATAGGSLRTVPMMLAVFVTLVVYWVAEEYAQLEAHANAGHLPTWRHVRSDLAAKWPMVSASYVPLLALIVARAVGAAPSNAAYIALAVTVVMLTFYGWSAGRASGLRGVALFLMTAAAGTLGALMILLKIIIAHLH
jgi:hypothetical protein